MRIRFDVSDRWPGCLNPVYDYISMFARRVCLEQVNS